MTVPNPYQPPSPGVSVPVVGIEPPLKKTSVWFILLMSFITFGFYPVYWFTSRRKAINALAGTNEISAGLCVFMWVLHAVYIFFPTPVENQTQSAGLALLGLVVMVLYLILFLKFAFGVKDALKANYAGDFSGLLTFFLHVVYLQYKINRLGEPLSASEHGRLFPGLGAG